MLKIKKMLENSFSEFFTPKLKKPEYYQLHSLYMLVGQSEDNHRFNMEEQNKANLELLWESQSKALVLMQRSTIVAILASILPTIAMIIVAVKK